MLVCGDAGAAGRILLAHRGLELRWALTLDEALTVLRNNSQRICLVREPLGEPILRATLKDRNRPPVVLLVDADGLKRQQLYAELGATALVRDVSGEKILAAISALSGITFGDDTPTAFETVLEVGYEGEHLYLESIDLSTSGVSIRAFPNPQVGARADITFAMLDTPVTIKAVLVRTLEEAGPEAVWFCFENVTQDVRDTIIHVIAEARRKSPVLPEPTGFSVDLAGQFTLDIHQALEQQTENPASTYVQMLSDWLTAGGKDVRIPGWLTRVAKMLTNVERKAMVTDKYPWARTAVELRIGLRRVLEVAEEGIAQVPPERVLEFCRTMALEAREAPPEVLDEVTRIRATLLQEVYGAPLKERVDAAVTQFDGAPQPLLGSTAELPAGDPRHARPRPS